MRQIYKYAPLFIWIPPPPVAMFFGIKDPNCEAHSQRSIRKPKLSWEGGHCWSYSRDKIKNDADFKRVLLSFVRNCRADKFNLATFLYMPQKIKALEVQIYSPVHFSK